MAKSQHLSNLPNAPAFSAIRSSSGQSITTGTWTKVEFNSEDYDTASAYDNATNYRFTPLVAGYYQVSGAVYVTGTSVTSVGLKIYKNGSAGKLGSFNYMSANDGAANVSAIVYMNGSSDYIELWAYATATSPVVSSATDLTHFEACLIRPA